ncbi:MAG: DUF2007 domain-containing protein [Acidobacteriota bacterium]
MAYTKVGHFNSRLEAETIGNALTQYDIPFLVRSEDVGIFGPGYTGATPLGASLWVPEEDLPRVRELLTCLFEVPGEES